MGTVVVFAAFALPEPTDFSAFGPDVPTPVVVPMPDTDVVRVAGGTRITHRTPSGTKVWTVPDPYVATPEIVEALKRQMAAPTPAPIVQSATPQSPTPAYRFVPYKTADCQDGRCPVPR